MKTIIFSLMFTLLFCMGCPDQSDMPDSVITIRNNSSGDVLHFLEYRAPVDTALPLNSIFPSSENIPITIINANSERDYKDSYIQGFKDNPDKVLMIYLFSRDTIEQVSWDRIVDEYLILKRYDVTLEDLEAMEWKVEYP